MKKSYRLLNCIIANCTCCITRSIMKVTLALSSHNSTDSMYFFQWSCEDVANWIESLGFPQYKECFTENFISGRKLIHVNYSNLPKLGITDFQHIKVICAEVQAVLGIREAPWSRNFTDPPQDPRALFLLLKSPTGAQADSLSYQQFTSRLQHE